jgi:hypothetical protein
MQSNSQFNVVASVDELYPEIQVGRTSTCRSTRFPNQTLPHGHQDLRVGTVSGGVATYTVTVA